MLQIVYPNHSSGRAKHIFEHKVNIASGKNNVLFSLTNTHVWFLFFFGFFFFFCARLSFPPLSPRQVHLPQESYFHFIFISNAVAARPPARSPTPAATRRCFVWRFLRIHTQVATTERFLDNSIVVVSHAQSFFTRIQYTIRFHSRTCKQFVRGSQCTEVAHSKVSERIFVESGDVFFYIHRNSLNRYYKSKIMFVSVWHIIIIKDTRKKKNTHRLKCVILSEFITRWKGRAHMRLYALVLSCWKKP